MSISTNKIRNYLREISAIVIGVAITLSASYWLGLRNEKRDMALYLNAIRLELEDNIKTLETAIENLQLSIRYTNYLKSNDKKSLNKDSLKMYQYAYYTITDYTFKTNAFEMFKSSGIMRLVDDKELLLSLWDVYEEFESVKETFDWFLPMKWEDMKKEFSLIIEEREVKAPTYNFYIMDFPSQMVRPCKSALKKSQEMVSRLEEMKMVKPFVTSEVKSSLTDEDLDKYLGVYSSEPSPQKITITKVDNKLFLQVTGQASVPLKAMGEDKFEYAPSDLVIEFNPTENTMVLKQDGNEVNFKREDCLK